MSPKTQAKVLRVLQEGEVERLGSARTIKVDVRVIAATNKDLEEEIEQGHLPRGPVLPPEPSSRSACRRCASGPRTSRCSCSTSRSSSAATTTAGPRASRRQAIDALQRARWKGNIRELRNTVERLLIMAPGELDRRRRRARRRARSTPPRPVPTATGTKPGTLREFKEVAERAFLVEKLRENGWNISKTAEVDRHAAQQPVQEARAVPDIKQDTDG